MRISIFGLGYVGSVTAACLAREGHEVLGVDVNPLKVEAIQHGRSPFVEPGLPELMEAVRAQGRLDATGDGSHAVQTTDASMICVGTPSRRRHGLDLTYMRKVAAEIGKAISGKSSGHLVILRSTLLPGTTRDVVIPILEESSGTPLGERFGVCYNPEFLREGTAIHDFYHPPKTVIGSVAAEDGDRVEALYRALPAPVIRTDIAVAEMVKYADNTFHALKIAFANEIGRFCKAQGIDSHAVMEVFCQDRKLNISDAYLKPGFAFGGSCLPKDLRALIHRATQQDVEVPLLRSILQSNRQQVGLTVERIRDTGKKRIGFVGLSFKAETDDLRESPLVETIETLLGKGYAVRIFDRNVSLARLHGANRQYIEEHIPHLSALLADSIEEVVDASEVIVLGNPSEACRQALEQAREDQICIDLVRITDAPKTKARYDGLSW